MRLICGDGGVKYLTPSMHTKKPPKNRAVREKRISKKLSAESFSAQSDVACDCQH
jgi:hypothetical protein